MTDLRVVSENPDLEMDGGNLFEFKPESLDDLRRKRLVRQHAQTIELDRPKPGEVVIGELNEAEQAVFVELAIVNEELSELHKSLIVRSVEILAQAIKDTETPTEAFQEHAKKIHQIFPSKEDAEHYFGMQTRHEYLRTYFDFSIRERFGHAATYGVRAGFQVVRLSYKYELPTK